MKKSNVYRKQIPLTTARVQAPSRVYVVLHVLYSDSSSQCPDSAADRAPEQVAYMRARAARRLRRREPQRGSRALGAHSVGGLARIRRRRGSTYPIPDTADIDAGAAARARGVGVMKEAAWNGVTYMYRSMVLLVALLLDAAALAAGGIGSAAGKQPPHLFLFIVDDLGCEIHSHTRSYKRTHTS
jgi:hypothetical protein